jgi:hypothetical protein
VHTPHINKLGLVWVGIGGLSTLVSIFSSTAPERQIIVPEWVWLLWALVLLLGRGFWVSRDQNNDSDFEFEVTNLQIVNHRKQVQDERVFYLADCRVDIEIQNNTPNDIWLSFDFSVVDTDLPPIVVMNEDIRFGHTRVSRRRETQDRTPMKIDRNEIINDGSLRTKFEIELTPIEKMMPKLGHASSLTVAVKASQSKDKYTTRQIVSRDAVDTFIKDVEEKLIADVRNHTHQTLWVDGIKWLKLLWKGEE